MGFCFVLEVLKLLELDRIDVRWYRLHCDILVRSDLGWFIAVKEEVDKK